MMHPLPPLAPESNPDSNPPILFPTISYQSMSAANQGSAVGRQHLTRDVDDQRVSAATVRDCEIRFTKHWAQDNAKKDTRISCPRCGCKGVRV